MNDGLFWIAIVVLIVMFVGQPDLHDKLLALMSCKP